MLSAYIIITNYEIQQKGMMPKTNRRTTKYSELNTNNFTQLCHLIRLSMILGATNKR